MYHGIVSCARKIQDGIVKGLTAAATAMLVPMMFLVTADVICRYVLNSPIPAVLEINSNFLMVLVVFFPLAYVHRRKEHVFVILFTEGFPVRVKLALEIVSILLGFCSFALIGWFGLETAVAATRVKEYIPGVIEVPIWISQWIIPIGAFAFCVELLLDGLEHVGAMFNPPPE
jgi:TRAP-type C4-dicarboxylate transport system permease small subunit